jgi:hypothetical protein
MSCDKEVSFGIVDEAVTEDLPDGDLKKAWDNLNNKYQPKTKAALTKLKSEFHKTVLGNRQDPDEWISDLERKRWRLKEMKAPVNDVNFLIHLITNLTEEYDMIVELYQDKIGNGQQDELKVEVLREASRNKFARLNKAKKSGADSALAATGKFKGKCSFCRKVGHKAENCWHQEKNNQGGNNNNNGNNQQNNGGSHGGSNRNNNNNNNQNSDKSKMKCWYCGETGHSKKDCLKQKSDCTDAANSASEGGKQSEMVMSGFVEKDIDYGMNAIGNDVIGYNTWIADSGASAHLTNNEEGLFDVKLCKLEVQLGNNYFVKVAKVRKLNVIIQQKDGKTTSVLLDEVKYVPELGYNLFSLLQVIH